MQFTPMHQRMTWCPSSSRQAESVSQMPFSLLPLATFTFQYLMGDFLELEQVVTSPTPVVRTGLYMCLMTHRYVSNSFFRSNVNVQESGNMS